MDKSLCSKKTPNDNEKYFFRNLSPPLAGKVKRELEFFRNELNPFPPGERKEKSEKFPTMRGKNRINLKVQSMLPLRNEGFEEKDRSRKFFLKNSCPQQIPLGHEPTMRCCKRHKRFSQGELQSKF